MSRSIITLRARRFLAVAAAASLGATLAPATAAVAQDGQWWHQQWEMDQVWPISDGGGVTVAVLDSGVDASVPELAGKVVSGADFGEGGGDGTVDRDEESHGTTMAALIAGSGGDNGYVGVAPGATILPVAISWAETGFPPDLYAEGIRFAVDNGAQVINISLGSAYATVGAAVDGCQQVVADAVRYAVDNDVIVVASSGNVAGGESEVPGRCPGVLTVGASDAQLNPWQDSHRSEYVEVAAPGVGVAMVGSGGRTGTGTGTSNATALVSGAIALMRAQFPNDSADTILRRVIYTAGEIQPEGWDDATGYGLVQPLFALTEELPPDAPNPVYEGLEQVGTEPTEGGLPGASPLAPADSASDSASGGITPIMVLAILGGLFVIAIVVVIVVVVTISNKNKRRPPGHRPQYPPPQQPPPPYLGSPGARR